MRVEKSGRGGCNNLRTGEAISRKEKNGGKYFVAMMFVQRWIHRVEFCKIFCVFCKVVRDIAERC